MNSAYAQSAPPQPVRELAIPVAMEICQKDLDELSETVVALRTRERVAKRVAAHAVAGSIPAPSAN